LRDGADFRRGFLEVEEEICLSHWPIPVRHKPVTHKARRLDLYPALGTLVQASYQSDCHLG